MDASISIANLRLANLPDPAFEGGLTGAAGLVVVGLGVERQDLACPPDRYRPVCQHPLNKLTLPGRH